MADVKKKDIELVTNALEDFFKYSLQIKNFNVTDFKNFMENIFGKASYREFIENNQSNILIMHDYGVGDFIMITGAVREIRRLYPAAHITLTVRENSLSVAECCPYVDEIILNERQFENTGDIADFYEWDVNLARKLLCRRFDVCYAFTNYDDSALLMYMSGAKTRIARKIKKSALYSELATFPIPAIFAHNADCFMFFIECVIHSRVANRELEVWYTPLDFGVARSFISEIDIPIYALCMGGTAPKRHYPPEKYAVLAEMILSNEDAVIAIVGGGQADLNSAQIFKNSLPENCRKKIIDLTDKLTYRQSAALLSFSNMYIGNDTGTMHIAAAVNCPVLEPNCCGANLPYQELRIVQSCSPYHVPGVVVQPKYALPECAENEVYETFGCRADTPHCITQIEPETLYEGFKILKKRVEEKIIETLYIN